MSIIERVFGPSRETIVDKIFELEDAWFGRTPPPQICIWLERAKEKVFTPRERIRHENLRSYRINGTMPFKEFGRAPLTQSEIQHASRELSK